MIEDITHEATLAHPPELVWRAITEKDLIRTWLMEGDYQGPTVGHRFEFRDRPRPFWDGKCPCEVLEADAPRRFALRWGASADASVVSWDLEALGDGSTRVRFRHKGLHGIVGWIMKKGMTKGWRRMLDLAIPFVLEALKRGETPTRDQVKAAAAAK